MKKLLMVFACITALAVLLNVRSASAQGKLEGVWKLTEITIPGPNAQKITNPQPNLVVFTKKHFIVVSVMGDKPRPNVPQKGATDAQKVAAWEPFVAEAGTYDVKGTIITAKNLVAKDPIQMAPGNFATSEFKIEGNTFTLTPKTDQNGPVSNPNIFKLVRLE